MNNETNKQQQIPDVPAQNDSFSQQDRQAHIADPTWVCAQIVRILDQKKAMQLSVLHVREQTVLADYFVICTATSFTHIHALRDELEFQMGQLDVSLLRADGEERGGWLILDFGCVMVHLFVQNMRTFYHLEKLWSDAEPIEPQVLMQSAGVHATENVTAENTAADTVLSDVSADPS